jgi:hypothetical protein
VAPARIIFLIMVAMIGAGPTGVAVNSPAAVGGLIHEDGISKGLAATAIFISGSRRVFVN